MEDTRNARLNAVAAQQFVEGTNVLLYHGSLMVGRRNIFTQYKLPLTHVKSKIRDDFQEWKKTLAIGVPNKAFHIAAKTGAQDNGPTMKLC